MAIASVGVGVPMGVGVRIDAGTGSPEGLVTGSVGALWIQTDGLNGEVLWRKATGTSNTGWLSYGTITNGTFTSLTTVNGTFTGTLTGVSGNFTGDLTAAGGFRQTVDGFLRPDVAASLTNQELIRFDIGGVLTSTRFRAVRAGSITGVIATLSEARTAGTLTVDVFKNTGLAGAAGASIGLTAVIDVTNTSRKATTQAKDTDSFLAGDEIYAVVTTDAGWLPVTSDLRVAIEIEN